MRGETLRSNFAVLLGLAWLVVVAQLLAIDWNDTARTLLDTDDALRLVQVREFLAGQGWFDLHEARLGPPLGYDSHWSRLIDAGLAGLFLFFNIFANMELAERLMRVVWPLLWLLPPICAVAALAWRIAGREAALVVLLMVVIGMPAFLQFRPGRIDHHNVQIALVLATLAAAAWADRKRWAAAAAGGFTGLALAIGLEGFPLLVVAGAALALAYVFDRAGAGALRRYGLALSLSAIAAFLVSVGPDHWSRAACDAIAVNWMAPLAIGGLLLAAATYVPGSESAVVRGGAVVAIGVFAAAIFLAIDPRCLGGPYAAMNPILRPIWLAHVAEMQPLLSVLRNTPQAGAMVLAFPAAAVVAMVWLLRDPKMRRNPGFLLNGAALLLAVAMMAAVIKVQGYAAWIGMPLVAAWAVALFARFGLGTLAARSLLVVLLTPAAMSAGAFAIAKIGVGGGNKSEPRVTRGCYDSVNYAQLAHLPKGLIATDLDYGPFILALTQHAVLGAPYHRLSEGIQEAHRSFALPPDAAREALAQNGATYLVTCGDYTLVGVSDAARSTSLGAHLSAGDVPAWLERVPAQGDSAFTVYRVNAGRQ